MTVVEYEARFWPPAPSLHQIFAEMENPHRTRRRRRRRLAAAAFIAVVTFAAQMVSDHSAHGPLGARHAKEPTFDVLPREFWHILERVAKRLERLVDHAESSPRDAMPQKAARLV
jgi:hypothetical protein